MGRTTMRPPSPGDAHLLQHRPQGLGRQIQGPGGPEHGHHRQQRHRVAGSGGSPALGRPLEQGLVHVHLLGHVAAGDPGDDPGTSRSSTSCMGSPPQSATGGARSLAAPIPVSTDRAEVTHTMRQDVGVWHPAAIAPPPPWWGSVGWRPYCTPPACTGCPAPPRGAAAHPPGGLQPQGVAALPSPRRLAETLAGNGVHGAPVPGKVREQPPAERGGGALPASPPARPAASPPSPPSTDRGPPAMEIPSWMASLPPPGPPRQLALVAGPGHKTGTGRHPCPNHRHRQCLPCAPCRGGSLNLCPPGGNHVPRPCALFPRKRQLSIDFQVSLL